MNVVYYNREQWAKTFTHNSKNQLCQLEHTPDGRLCLYVQTDKATGSKAVYHVWDGDKWLYCGQSERVAHDIYEKAKA